MDLLVENELQISHSRRQDWIKGIQRGPPHEMTGNSSFLNISKRTFPVQSQVLSRGAHAAPYVYHMSQATAAAPAIPVPEFLARLGQGCFGPRAARLLGRDEVLPTLRYRRHQIYYKVSHTKCSNAGSTE
jgi:hypothetical protein